MTKKRFLDPEQQKDFAERQAALMLMQQWVKENTDKLTDALLDLVPFICGECNTTELQRHMNVVNVTFADIALSVIRSRNECDADRSSQEPMSLPADAMEMQNAVYDLSRFLKKFQELGSLLENNSELPAFRMAVSKFDQLDSM